MSKQPQTEAERFLDLTRRIVNVPKEKVDALAKKLKQQKTARK